MKTVSAYSLCVLVVAVLGSGGIETRRSVTDRRCGRA
jgi:hypothetical protein